MTTKFLVSILVVIIVVLGGFFGYRYFSNKNTNLSYTETLLPKTSDSVEKSSSQDKNLKDYTIEEASNSKHTDSKITLKNKQTREKTILIDSTKNLLNVNPSGSMGDLDISLVGFNDKEIYFSLSGYEGPESLYVFDVNSRKIRRPVGELYQFIKSPFGNESVAVAPTGAEHYFADKIVLMCFKDTSQKIITLSKGEVLNSQIPEMDNYITMKWSKQNTIEYYVYKYNYNSDEYAIRNTLLRKDTFETSCK